MNELMAALLGHSTIQMSARYTHATDEAKRSAVEAITRAANVVEMPSKMAAAGNDLTKRKRTLGRASLRH